MIFGLIGKTCSGKTTALKQLSSLGFKTPISYTTRPKRQNEVDGVDYNFVTIDEFNQLVKNGKIIAPNTFKSAFSTYWSYGMDADSIDPDETTICIIEPKGHYALLSNYGSKYRSIYLNTPTEVRLLRGLNRRDDVNELLRRFYSDEIDFKGFEDVADYIVVGLEKQEILDQILKIIRKETKK